MTNEQLIERYGMTKAELLASASRERALGNNLVAACLTDAANGNILKKRKENKMLDKIKNMAAPELAGWLAMVMLHSNTIPTTVGKILGYNSTMPPLSMVLLTWAGLALYLWRAVYQKDMLYIVSNGIGFMLNSVLLAIIVFPLA